MKRSDISIGNRLILSNGTTIIVYNVRGVLYIASEGSYYLGQYLRDLCDDDLRPLENCAEIEKILDCKGNTIWTRPVEMTVAEIETALKLVSGTLRIKK